MAGQGLERREVLRVMALAAAASQFPGFSRWTFACDHIGAQSTEGAPAKPAAYLPQFFTPEEYATVERLSELIIPSEGSAGAREAGVSEFVDFMVFSDPGVQYRFRYGLTWLDAHAQQLYGETFRALTPDRQTEILQHLAYKDRYREGEDEGREFFKLVREYVVMGFYTSRVGLEELDYPGLKFYSESPGCPHGDDPEHLHLPKVVKD
ncbi:MAG TPA: gluconate 2-dehydrogenase subunit 3 family protein [Terriglobia bacterium]